MERSRGLRLVVGALGVLLILAVPGGTATARSEPAQPVRQALPPVRPTLKHPKIDSQLFGVARAYRQRGEAAALADARRRGLRVVDGKVRVVAESRGANPAAARAVVRALRGRVEAELGPLVQALLPPAAITRVGGHPAVRFVRPPFRPFPANVADEAVRVRAPCPNPQFCPPPDPVAGEGVNAMNANVWHAAGLRGAGQKVAVIDVGFKGYKARQASGDLPNPVVTKDFCPAGEFDGPAASEHGTAAAEIVHETAPDAELYLVCIVTEVNLAIGWSVAVSEGARVISHSMAWFNTGRGDGSSADVIASPESSVQLANDSGALWVNSAGNRGKQHWSGKFDDPDGDGWHNFEGYFDESNGLVIPAGEEACVFLKWDDWPESDQDYDMYLYKSPIFYKFSENQQSGTQTPTEWFCQTNSASVPVTYQIVIKKESATKNPRLDLFVTGGSLTHTVQSGSVVEPASSPKAMAVGAICWNNDKLLYYSSRGPTIDGRIKPDIAGQAHVSSATPKYGAFKSCGANSFSGGFGGTSAAAPHVAGAAALVRSASALFLPAEKPDTPAKLQAILEGRAVDLGASGKDNSFGAGKLWLGNPPPQVAAICCAPLDIKIKVNRGEEARQTEFEGTARICRTCSVASVRWSFGDGQTSTRNPVRHTYERPGTYRVTFQVVDDRGRSGSTSEIIRIR